MKTRPPADAQHWYKDAIVYQLHVRAFYDSNRDGIGDFRGLTEKLDYLRDLGITAIWLLPFYPSPLKDDGYDIADYCSVNPDYGSLADFKAFLRAAHARGLRVITEMVLNHCSDQSVWFQRARHAKPDDPARDFFVWSDTPEKYQEARIIFHDFEASNWTWDPVAGAYYWHRFYHHQPDLNFENPEVQREMISALDYWLDMGVDGVRLDAVPYLFQREGTTCENLPETHAFLKQLRSHVDAKYEDCMFLAEANQWPEDAVAYFGDGDECHTAFHFPVMPRLFMAVQMEDRFPIIDILEQTPAIPDNCQWFVFLRNHDELTLEMVTDEERDYMYRMYASQPQARLNQGIRRRLAPLLRNDRRKIELMNGLLMSLPGTPVIYYGDEIGMGDNIYLGDRDGVRTPMQWSADRNAGFSRANAQRLFLPVIVDHEYHYEAVNVETQQQNPHSMLWWMKRIIALRQRFRHVFGSGSLEFLFPENNKVLAFMRSSGEHRILVVANLSRFAQFVQLDLSAHLGATPRELVGQTLFPRIGELPYLLTLGPHAIHWFAIEESRSTNVSGESVVVESALQRNPPKIIVAGHWSTIFSERYLENLEFALPPFLRDQPWFQGSARTIEAVRLVDRFELECDGSLAAPWLTVLRVDYTDGEHEFYLLPLSFAATDSVPWVGSDYEPVVIADLATDDGEGKLFDACGTEAVSRFIFALIRSRACLRGDFAELSGEPTEVMTRLWEGDSEPQRMVVPLAGQSMASVIFDDSLLLKLFRRIDEGISPDLEIRHWLKQVNFAHTPELAGQVNMEISTVQDADARDKPSSGGFAIDTRPEPWTIGILQQHVRHEGTAFDFAVSSLDQDLDAQLTVNADSISDTMQPLVQLLGRRIADLHRALAASPADHPFAPEPITTFYRRSLYQRIRSEAVRIFRRGRTLMPRLSEQSQRVVTGLLRHEQHVLTSLSQLLVHRIAASRIRCHGNLHLRNILFVGNDFQFVNFEGLPGQALTQRRLKRSPLSDVSTLLHSLLDVRLKVTLRQRESGVASPEQAVHQQQAADNWLNAFGATLLDSYLAAAEGTVFVSPQRKDTLLLLNSFRLERALQQIGYDLSHAPQQLPYSGDHLMRILNNPSNQAPDVSRQE